MGHSIDEQLIMINGMGGVDGSPLVKPGSSTGTGVSLGHDASTPRSQMLSSGGSGSSARGSKNDDLPQESNGRNLNNHTINEAS